jgi:hypothetical protein
VISSIIAVRGILAIFAGPRVELYLLSHSLSEALKMVNWRKFWRRLGVALNLRDPPNLPHYGWSYFDHLIAVYVTLNTADTRADEVIRKSSERPDDLTWGDVFLLENIVFSLQPPEVVARNTWIIRERFREIACPSVYEKYTNSNLPTDTDTPAKLALLKADLTRILDVLHWHYSLIPMRERMRKSLTKYCILYVVLYTILLGAFLLFVCRRHHFEFAAMLACVVYWGIVGGFVSSQRRMESIPNDGDPLISVFGLDSADYYLWLSPLLGAIFAIVLSFMFIGGVLKGSVFPAFYTPHVGKEGLENFWFAWETVPTTAEEYGKLFVWAFLAGFAERLVPDSLDRLASKLTPSDKLPAPRNTAVDSKTPPQPPSAKASDASTKISTETLQNVMRTGEAPIGSEEKEDDKR